MRPRAALSILLALALAGCSSMPSPADLVDKPAPGDYLSLASHNKLIDHPSPAVSAPAGIGLGLGTIIGIPVMIVALPITIPLGISAFSQDAKVSNMSILGNAIAWPDAVVALGGCYALGGIPYALIGDSPRPTRSAPRATPPPLPSPPARGAAPKATPGAEDDLAPRY